MKLKALLLLLFFTVLSSKAQDYFPDKEKFNGTYYSLKPMKLRSGGVATEMICQVGKMGNIQVLAIAACEKCMPGVYTFKPSSSKEIKRAMFYNKYGAMAIEYDENSFVVAYVTADKPRVDFYSKSKSKVAAMTEEKALEFVMKFSDQL